MRGHDHGPGTLEPQELGAAGRRRQGGTSPPGSVSSLQNWEGRGLCCGSPHPRLPVTVAPGHSLLGAGSPSRLSQVAEVWSPGRGALGGSGLSLLLTPKVTSEPRRRGAREQTAGPGVWRAAPLHLCLPGLQRPRLAPRPPDTCVSLHHPLGPLCPCSRQGGQTQGGTVLGRRRWSHHVGSQAHGGVSQASRGRPET